jgi:hypothetical protein
MKFANLRGCGNLLMHQVYSNRYFEMSASVKPLVHAVVFYFAFAALSAAAFSVEPPTEGWMPPETAAPGLEISGNPHIWQRIHAKALDPVYDGVTGRRGTGDLMGFWFDQEIDRLALRISLYRPGRLRHSGPKGKHRL